MDFPGTQVEIEGEAGTLSSNLTQLLADEIISGRIAPGTRLDEAGLAKRFGVSRTPVREAIRHLGATGLIKSRPRRGAFAATLPEQRMMEMFEALADIDAVCARLCALKMSDAERRQLEHLHQRCRQLASSGDTGAYHRANLDFHTLIYQGTHNAFLRDHGTALRTRFAPFSRAQFRGPGRLAHSFAEHDTVVRAILASDGELALSSMRYHGLNTGRAYAAYIASVEPAASVVS